jgi:hypothetical protein
MSPKRLLQRDFCAQQASPAARGVRAPNLVDAPTRNACMTHLWTAALFAAHFVALSAAFGPPAAPVSLARRVDASARNAALAAPRRTTAAPSSALALSMAGERFDRRRVAGLFGALLGFAPEAFAQGRGVPKSADDIVTDDMTLDKYEAMAEKLRAAALENRNRPKPPPAAAPAGGKVGTSQWELIRETFRGRWTGPTKWFGRAPDASAALNWETPSVDIPKSVYDISFSDANTGVWRGTGLRFTDKELVLNLNGPGSSRTTCMFPGGLGSAPHTPSAAPQLLARPLVPPGPHLAPRRAHAPPRRRASRVESNCILQDALPPPY